MRVIASAIACVLAYALFPATALAVSGEPVGELTRLGVAASGPGSLLREGNRVLAEVRFDHGAAIAGAEGLRTAGARVIEAGQSQRTVTVAARPADLPGLRAVPGVAGVTGVLAPQVYGSGAGPGVAATAPCFGAETSEGDSQLRAAEAREAFGVDGGGVTVGILSDSFDTAASAPTHAGGDVASGDLPGLGSPCGRIQPVQILQDYEASNPFMPQRDEGRAMAQIVHDLAPGARLSFATAFTGLHAFAANVEALAAAGAEAIVDDVFYYEEPFFQEGPVGVAVREVTADGVSYFSSAGNHNLIVGGRNVGSWETPQFRDSASCPAGLVAHSEAMEEASEPGLNPEHCLDFDPGSGVDETFAITVADGARLIVDLQWAEAWNGVGTDVDAFLLDAGGVPLVESTEDNVLGSQQPLELIAWENETGGPATVQLAINRFAGGDPRLKFALVLNGAGGVTATEYPESSGPDVVGPTIFGHNGAADAVSVGAIRYNTRAAPETFSSRGPVTHYFGPVTGILPAAPLDDPLVLGKPDMVATDGGANTFFGFDAGNVWRFFGTSAAAPHAAAVAALLRQADPSLTPDQTLAALSSGADSIAGFGSDAIGAGIVDAMDALDVVADPLPPGEEKPDGEQGGSTPTGAGPASPPAGPVASAKKPPLRTHFLRRPPKAVSARAGKAKVVFRFGASEPGATFLCRVDSGSLRPCPARFVRSFAIGRHVVEAVARDAAGDLGAAPAVWGFRVRRSP